MKQYFLIQWMSVAIRPGEFMEVATVDRPIPNAVAGATSESSILRRQHRICDAGLDRRINNSTVYEPRPERWYFSRTVDRFQPYEPRDLAQLLTDFAAEGAIFETDLTTATKTKGFLISF